LWLIICFAIAVISLAAPAKPMLLFVATNGNDAWSGTSAIVKSGGKDGPLATVQYALGVAREVRRANAAAEIQIVLRNGIHFLSVPLVLKPEDSGITFAGYEKERPVLSGGRRISGWKVVPAGQGVIWSAEVPEVREGKWFFRELWVNGTRATRARYPNEGYLALVDAPDKTPEWTQGQASFHFRPNDLAAWPTITNAEVIVMDRWVESRLPVTGLNEAQHLLSFGKKSVFQLSPGDLYYLEGALDFLDVPGEWCLERSSGMVFYRPRQGETLARMEAVGPVLSQVVRLEGKPESKQFIERVTFRDLTFAHTEWCFPEGFQSARDKPAISPEPKSDVGGFGQAAIGVPAAVLGEGVRGSLFERCSFEHIGNYGLELGRGCSSNRIDHCDFDDLGAGGLKLGETAIRSKPAELARANEVTHCHIYDGGKLFASAIGIWIGESPDNKLTYNLIHDFFYTGISIGWTWGYGPSATSNNVVAFNHVHHIGEKANQDGPILSDMGGIYTLGMQPGTRVVNNLWHDIAGLRYGGWGIYFDEGSSSILAESNLVYRTTHGGFHQHYGATNLLRNNIFAFARDHQLQRTRPEPHPSFIFTNNIVYYDTGVLLGGDWAGEQYVLDHNIYFDARTGTNRTVTAGLTQSRARKHDANSVIADPLFAGPKQDNFRLGSESPALKLGFHPIDISQAGMNAGRPAK
jgi:hypothetical protein